MGAVGRPVESRNWWRLSFVILSPWPLLARTWCSETLWPAPEGGPAHLGRYPEVRGAPCRNGPAPCGPPGSCSSSSACRSASWRPSGPWPMPGSTSSRSGSSGNPGLRTSSRASVVSSGSLRLSDTSCTGRVGTRATGQGPSPSERPRATARRAESRFRTRPRLRTLRSGGRTRRLRPKCLRFQSNSGESKRRGETDSQSPPSSVRVGVLGLVLVVVVFARLAGSLLGPRGHLAGPEHNRVPAVDPDCERLYLVAVIERALDLQCVIHMNRREVLLGPPPRRRKLDAVVRPVRGRQREFDTFVEVRIPIHRGHRAFNRHQILRRFGVHRVEGDTGADRGHEGHRENRIQSVRHSTPRFRSRVGGGLRLVERSSK